MSGANTNQDQGGTDYDNTFSPASIRSPDRISIGEADDTFPTGAFDDNGSLLGVIVDRSSFDEDDELTTYRDAPSVIHNNRHASSSQNMPQHHYHQHNMMEAGSPLGGAVVMRNGKVRRKMRWKPRFGKKKSNNFSSNASVISALTNRSSGTNRSSSTTKSFLSHFSRKSNNSFHTFHSTETPVATNKANRPTAPHMVMRPNYQDSFDAKQNNVNIPKHATIDTEGKYTHHHSRMGGGSSSSRISASQRSIVSSSSSSSSSLGFPSTRLDSVQESSSYEYEQQAQEEVEVNRSPTLSSADRVFHNNNNDGNAKANPGSTNTIETINVTGDGNGGSSNKNNTTNASSNNSVGARSIRSATSKGSSQQKTPIPVSPKNSKAPLQQQSKPKRPPLFKRRLRNHNKNKASESNSSIHSTDSLLMLTSPTGTNSTASLSPLSLERENSGLPVLRGDEEDRLVAITSESLSFSSTKKKPLVAKGLIEEIRVEDDVEESSVSPTVQSSVSGSQSGGGGLSIQSGSSAVVSLNSATANLQNRVTSVTKKSSSSSASAGSSTLNSNTNSPQSPEGASERSSQPVAVAASKTTPFKQYNRPLDSTSTVDDNSKSGSAKLKAKMGARNKNTSVACDLDEGSFLEAEHNLRAIHEMAAEHLAHGEYEEAADVFEEILRGQQQRYGQDHYRVGTALHNLGIVHLKKKDYQKAIEICQRAVNVRKESLVPNHPDVAVSLAQLGVAHLESENYHEAFAAFQEALFIRRNFLGPRHTKCSKILNNIGCALYAIEDFAKAKRAFDEALDIQRDALRSLPSKEGAESNGTQSNTLLLSMASTLCNIGSIQLRWGDFDEAEKALEEALLVRSCYEENSCYF